MATELVLQFLGETQKSLNDERQLHERTKAELALVKGELARAHYHIQTLHAHYEAERRSLKRQRDWEEEENSYHYEVKKSRSDVNASVIVEIPLYKERVLRLANKIPHVILIWDMTKRTRYVVKEVLQTYLPSRLLSQMQWVGFCEKWRETRNLDVIVVPFKVSSSIRDEFVEWIHHHLGE